MAFPPNDLLKKRCYLQNSEEGPTDDCDSNFRDAKCSKPGAGKTRNG